MSHQQPLQSPLKSLIKIENLQELNLQWVINQWIYHHQCKWVKEKFFNLMEEILYGTRFNSNRCLNKFNSRSLYNQTKTISSKLGLDHRAHHLKFLQVLEDISKISSRQCSCNHLRWLLMTHQGSILFRHSLLLYTNSSLFLNICLVINLFQWSKLFPLNTTTEVDHRPILSSIKCLKTQCFQLAYLVDTAVTKAILLLPLRCSNNSSSNKYKWIQWETKINKKSKGIISCKFKMRSRRKKRRSEEKKKINWEGKGKSLNSSWNITHSAKEALGHLLETTKAILLCQGSLVILLNSNTRCLWGTNLCIN